MSAARGLAALGNQNTLAVETGSAEVGIASTAPSSTLDVRGEVKVGTNIQLGNAGVITASSYSGSFPIVDASSLAVSGISTLVRLAVTDEVVTGIITALGLSGNLTGAAATISGALNVDGTTDSTSVSTGALIVDGGVGIAKNVYIGAGLSVAGTLTYEDVTNVDSVGMVTAKSGVNVSGGELNVGLGFSVGNVGVVTANGATFNGDVTIDGDITLTGASVNCVWDKSDNALEFAAQAIAAFGASSALQVYNNGTDNYVDSTVGHLYLRGPTDASKTIVLQAHSGDNSIVANPDGSVEAYYDNSKKFETTNDGVVITGICTADGLDLGDNESIKVGNSDDFEIKHDGSDSWIRDSGTGKLCIDSSQIQLRKYGAAEVMANFIEDGSVQLYHNNSLAFETTVVGAAITSLAHDGGLTISAGSNNQSTSLVIKAKASGGTEYTGRIDVARGNGDISISDGSTSRAKFGATGNIMVGFTSTKAGLAVTGGLFEGAWIKAGKLSDNKTIGISSANVFYFTTQETTTATPNIVWNDTYSLSSKMNVGDIASVTVVTTAAAGGYSANWTIDGNAVTEEWVGGSAPSSGGSDGLDIYSLTIIKTGTGTGDSGFKVIANVSNAT